MSASTGDAPGRQRGRWLRWGVAVAITHLVVTVPAVQLTNTDATVFTLLVLALVVPGIVASMLLDVPLHSASYFLLMHGVSCLFFGVLGAVAATWSSSRRFGLWLGVTATAGGALLLVIVWLIGSGLAAKGLGGP
jgi:hypothetical protein